MILDCLIKEIQIEEGKYEINGQQYEREDFRTGSGLDTFPNDDNQFALNDRNSDPGQPLVYQDDDSFLHSLLSPIKEEQHTY